MIEENTVVFYDIEQLEALAKKNEPIPQGLNSAQINFYLNMLLLCKCYKQKSITKEEATNAKKELYAAYYRENRMVEIWQDALEIRKKLCGISKQAYTGTCETCKKMIRIFDGLEK